MAGDLPKVLSLQRESDTSESATRTGTMIAESWVTVLYSYLRLYKSCLVTFLDTDCLACRSVEFLDAAGALVVSCLVQAVQIYKNG